MTDSYLPIVVMVVLATGFAVLSFAASTFLAPKRPTAAKLAPYECGIIPDIESVFLYPWAVMYRQLELFGLVEMGLFLAAVLVAYGYLLASGALHWGPSRKAIGRVSEPVLRSTGRAEERAA
ncbi:MAG: NADH-quinone oxidoreductase subunit A [Actinobacteria bacterium]|nr:NADH-quinone oxidoreductase subunit A [Actinomycetota bacterium]